MNVLLLICIFTMVGLVFSQDENLEISSLQTIVKNLMNKVEHLERKLQSLESDPLAVYFEDKSHDIKKRTWTDVHSNSRYANGTFVFCGDTTNVQKRSTTISSPIYNTDTNYINNTTIYCGGRAHNSRGVSFIVWGKQYCPYGQTLYSGVIGGNRVTHSAGGSNQLCLPDSPSYGQYSNGAQQKSLIYPGKYNTRGFATLSHVNGKLARCAACYNSGRSTSIMIPATVTCPRGWNQEYYGYLMTQPDVAGYYRQEYICVHKDMDTRNPLPGKSSHAYLLSPVETENNGGFNSFYDPTKELSCSVCSK